MTLWDARADAYRLSDAHAAGDDLEQIVTWARGARNALDVATGGGHVARRLRESGVDRVVTCDPSPGMHPDVICRAEDLPFAERSFDVVACRTAAHHFGDVAAAVREMARVCDGRVLIVDTMNMGDDVEQAETLRDPSHVRNYSAEEWRELIEGAGLHVVEEKRFEHSFDLNAWLERTECRGEDARKAVELLGDRAREGRLTLAKIAIHAERA